MEITCTRIRNSFQKLIQCLIAFLICSNILTAQDVDLELSMSIDNSVLVATQAYTLLLQVDNNSNTTATDLMIKLPIPSGMATGDITPTNGTYSTWSENWVIDELSPGDSESLTIQLGALDAIGQKIFFAEVVQVTEKDIDSTPDNNPSFIANEDDEVVRILSPNNAVASLQLEKFPVDFQLYPRDLNTNKGSINITGSINNETAFDKIKIRLSKQEAIVENIEVNLDFINGSAQFDVDIPITAERINYDISLFGILDDTETFLQRASQLVAGDVYFISGQSNAEAQSAQHPSDEDLFLRSYTSRFNWNELKFSFPGQWGARMGKFLSQENNVPIAIFNTAKGGQTISFFLPEDEERNYINAYQRLATAQVQDHLRAMIWFQGESDGYETSIEEYKSSFDQLYTNWIADYNPERFFIFQVRYQSCSAPNPFIFESHRQLANEFDNIGIMSTTNADHDSCHFYYENGYQLLGNRIARLVSRDVYNNNLSDVDAPNIARAYISGDNEITLEMQNTDDAMSILGIPWTDFVIEGTDITVVDGYTDQHKLILQLSDAPDESARISYLGHTGAAADWIVNNEGVGMVTFYDFLLSDPPPKMANVSLIMSVDTTTVSNGDLINLSLTINNAGPDKAYDIVVENYLAPGLAYENTPTNFDSSLGLWTIDSLANQESQTISLAIRVNDIEDDFSLFAQVISTGQIDPNAEAGNNNTLIPLEDDEAAIVINFDSFPTGLFPTPLEDIHSLSIKNIFPIPAKDQVHILIDAEKTIDTESKIYNSIGQVILTQENKLNAGLNQLDFNISSLDQGIYFILLQTNEGSKLIRFVK